MGWGNKFPGLLLIFTLNLIIYFATSFPVLNDHQTNPELGPFFQGDIKGNPLGKNGVPGEWYRWKKGILRFHVQDDYTFQEMWLIYAALLEIERSTCIEVEELLTSHYKEKHVFYSRDKSYCASAVGSTGRRQVIDLAPRCFDFGYGTPIHETLHALGFHHEQSREDRDDYVTINYKNILERDHHNFDIYPMDAFGVPYDYGSIMHYGPYLFAINSNVKTIEVKQPGAKIGLRYHMSASDIEKVNRMYKAECDSRIGR